jgi:AcrR family transcriptional regulator
MHDDDAILKAALDLVSERGYAALSVDQVAARSDSHPSELYGRWRSRSDIISELLRYHSDQPQEVPDTGDLHADLAAVIDRVVRAVHRVRALIATASSEAVRDPELARELRLFVLSWEASIRELISRAIEREELPAGIDRNWAAGLLSSTFWFRIVISGDLPREGVGERAAGAVLRSWGFRM